MNDLSKLKNYISKLQKDYDMSLSIHIDECDEVTRNKLSELIVPLCDSLGLVNAEEKISSGEMNIVDQVKNYLKTYEGVAAYMEKTVADANRCGYITTLFGRRRYLPELKSSNHNLRAFGERVAMNAPIQGTAADIIKIAMIRVYDRLKKEGLQAQLILQVHDELIVEAPEAEAARVTEILKQEMEGAVQLAVKLEVDAGSGKTWGEAH